MKISISYGRQFVKDELIALYYLALKVVDSSYFEYYLKTYENISINENIEDIEDDSDDSEYYLKLIN